MLAVIPICKVVYSNGSFGGLSKILITAVNHVMFRLSINANKYLNTRIIFINKIY